MTHDQVLMDVDRISIRLIAREPFYGHFFTHLVKQVSDEVPTAGVGFNEHTNTMVLLVNPEFWGNIKGDDDDETDELKYGVIKHELLHILFKHPFTHNKYSDKTLANVAADTLINQYILESQLPERDRLAMLQNFEDFCLEKDQTTDYYYASMKKEWEEIQQMLQEGSENQDGDGDSDSDSGSDSNGKGDSDNDEDDDGEGEEEGESQSNITNNPNWNKLNKSQQHLAKFASSRKDIHSTWNKIGKLKSGEQDFVKTWIDSTLQNAIRKAEISKGSSWRGTLPGGLLAYIDQLMDNLKPSVDWKRVLKLMTSNAQKTFRKPTLKRPSKRFGTFPGSKTQRYTKIMVAIDTSGSVDNESIAEFFGEMYHIFKAGAEVHVVECDTNIGRVWDYEGTPPDHISGRGGTTFDQPIHYANDEYKPDCLVYCTDGYAPPPDVECNCPIMWILCKNGSCEVDDMENFQGIKIKMDY